MNSTGTPPQPSPEPTPEPSSGTPRGWHKLTRHPAVSRTWPHVLLACGCALAITLLVTSHLQSSLGYGALDAVRQEAARVAHLNNLEFLLVDAEAGVRGYLLTGQPVYLEPYERATARLAQVTGQIRTDFADAADQRAQFEALIALVDDKRDIMAQAVAQRTMATPPANEMAGKLVMDEVRAQIASLRTSLVNDGQRGIAQSIGRFRAAQVIGVVLAAGSLALLLILFAVLQRQFELRERIGGLLAGENARLDEQVRLRTAELSELARYLTNTREAEKAHLARELHDELGALLTAAKLDTSWIARKLPMEVRSQFQEHLDRLQETLTQGIALKRRIIDDLQPPLLKDLGLVDALRALSEDIGQGQQLGVECSLPADSVDLDPERALALFRIAQEAFTNVLKYAHAQHARLRLGIADGWAELTVEDDGCGFDPAHPGTNRHGIAGMQHRVQTHAGTLSISSAPGRGTVVRARLPITGAPQSG